MVQSSILYFVLPMFAQVENITLRDQLMPEQYCSLLSQGQAWLAPP